MKATGIIRRIDDLGRIDIPKELRRTLRIKKSDPMEIFTNREGEIILKKYLPIGEMSTIVKQYAESLSQVSGHAALITDRDQFIAVSGGFKNILGKSLSAELEDRINRRDVLIASKEDKNFVLITDDSTEEYNQETICPIICKGNVIGTVMLLKSEEKEKMGKVEQALVLCAASFIGKLMEGDDAE